MKSLHVLRGCLVAAMVTFGANVGQHAAFAAPPDQTSPVEGVEVLTRGPVHEAFAETVSFDPQAGIKVSKMPPAAIEEVPPSQRPAGDHVSWIPGYWAWDEDRDDFLWVSGIWRALPPGRQWVPGYWSPAGDGSQWTSGYWSDAKSGEVQYLPEPPATVEAGPIGTAPSADSIWTPGSWIWNQNRYVWQPGSWVQAQQNWVWTPSHYQWSPRGYVFINGYFDYSVARRGVLFAPVYFNSSVYSQQGFTYSPAMAINMAVFGNQLFLRPNYGHYYFGDYYGSQYSNSGYYPWFSFNSGGHGYDPFYAQQSWQNRQNPGWAKTVQSDFQNRVDHEGARPPRTLADQENLAHSGDKSSEKHLVAAAPLDQLAKSKDSSLRLQPVTKDEQATLAKHGQSVQQFRSERQKLEAKGSDASSEKPAKSSEAATAKISKSPIVAHSSDELGKEHTPPKAHAAAPSDPKVEPKPRSVAPTTAARKPELTQEKPATDPKNPAKPLPKTETKPDVPKVDPKPTPKVEPKPAPKVESKPEAPKAEPKPIPKIESKPEAPKPAPKPEAPKAESNDKPKAENKEKPKK